MKNYLEKQSMYVVGMNYKIKGQMKSFARNHTCSWFLSSCSKGNKITIQQLHSFGT
jgi:hypothetical protein